MLIRARFFGDLRRNLDKKWVAVEIPEGSTLIDLLSNISSTLDPGLRDKIVEKYETKPQIRILVNGRNIDYLDKLITKLSDGDVVTIMPIAGGG